MKNIFKRIFALSLVFLFLLGTVSSYGYTHNRWLGYGDANSLSRYQDKFVIGASDINRNRWQNLNKNAYQVTNAIFTNNNNGNLVVEQNYSNYCHSLITTPQTTFSVDTAHGSVASVSAPADNFYSSWNGQSLNLPSDFRSNNWRWWKLTNNSNSNKSDKTKIRVKISNLKIYTYDTNTESWHWVDVDMYREVTYSILASAEALSTKPVNDSGVRNSSRYIALGKGLCDTLYIGAREVETINSFYYAKEQPIDENKVHIYTNITLKDIDSHQYAMFWKDRTARQYVTRNTILSHVEPAQNWSATQTNDEYNLLNNYLGDFDTNYSNDPRTNVSFLFDGDEIEYRFGRTANISMQEQYLGSGQDNFTFIIPDPNKTITDDDETEVNRNVISNITKDWTYNITQSIPDNQNRTTFSNFQLGDEIDKCLDVKDIKLEAVSNNSTVDVSNMFDLTTTKLDNGKTKIVANAKNSYISNASSSFYSYLSYTLKINVKVKLDSEKTYDEIAQELEDDGHFSNDKTALTFDNKGYSNIDNTNRDTNDVSTIVHLPNLKITKVADRFEYQVGDTIHYIVEVNNTNTFADTTYFTIYDDTLPNSVSLDRSSINVSGLDSSNYELTGSGNTWKITSNGDFSLPYGTTIKIEYDAKALKPSNTHLVDNTATTYAFGVDEQQAIAEVWVNSPKFNVTKVADKTKFNLGDTIKYTVEATNVNEGTLAKANFEDVLEYSGILNRNSIKVMGDGTDITNDCSINVSNNKISIITNHYLKNGDCELSNVRDTRRKMGYQYGIVPRSHEKITITYEVNLPSANTDDSQAILITDHKTLNNNVKAIPYPVYDGDDIKEDDTIPSGSDEADESLTINDPQLSIKKVSNKEAYKINKTGTYTLSVKQTKPNLIARNVVITDAFTNDSLSGITLNTNSIKVYLNGLDITSLTLISADNGRFTIITNKSISDQDEIIVTYNVKFNKTGYFSNMASADADNTPQVYDYNQVEVQVNGLPMTGGERNLLFTFIGLGILIIISIVVIRRKRRLVTK